MGFLRRSGVDRDRRRRGRTVDWQRERHPVAGRPRKFSGDAADDDAPDGRHRPARRRDQPGNHLGHVGRGVFARSRDHANGSRRRARVRRTSRDVERILDLLRHALAVGTVGHQQSDRVVGTDGSAARVGRVTRRSAGRRRRRADRDLLLDFAKSRRDRGPDDDHGGVRRVRDRGGLAFRPRLRPRLHSAASGAAGDWRLDRRQRRRRPVAPPDWAAAARRAAAARADRPIDRPTGNRAAGAAVESGAVSDGWMLDD